METQPAHMLSDRIRQPSANVFEKRLERPSSSHLIFDKTNNRNLMEVETLSHHSSRLGFRARTVAVLATVGLAAGLLVIAPSALAVGHVPTLTAASIPEVGIGQDNEPAGDLTLSFTADHPHAPGDTYDLALPAGVTYSALPTVTSTGTATVTVSLPDPDTLRIFVNAPGGTGDFEITDIAYDLTTAVVSGPVTVTGEALAAPAAADNAFATPAKVSTSSQVVSPGDEDVVLTDIVIVEQHDEGFVDGDLCITLDGDATFTGATTDPTVTSSPADGDTATVAAVDPAFVQLLVVADDTATTTLTVSGLLIDVGAGTGAITVVVTQGADPDCVGGEELHIAELRVAAAVTTARFAGADRIATARQIAINTFECGAGPSPETTHALIARADLFPDALAGSWLAGQRVGPILLVHTESVPDETLIALRQLGITDVTILGQTAAVSQAVEDELDSTPVRDCAGNLVADTTLSVTRVGGVNRFWTARDIAIESGTTVGELDGMPTGILATGFNFPDALASGPVAYDGEFPILLTLQDSLHPAAAAAIDERGITQLLIVGGTDVISQAQEDALVAQGINVIRLAGATRVHTAVEIATFARSASGLDWAATGANPTHANLARGDLFPDALTGGPHGGVEQSVILLTINPDALGSATDAFLRATDIFSLHLFGGTAAISTATETAARNAMAGA